MADGPETQDSNEERGTREETPPLTAEQFIATPEFRRLKKGMRKIVKVSKAEIEDRVQRARLSSPRAGNPNAPGRRVQKRNRSGK